MTANNVIPFPIQPGALPPPPAPRPMLQPSIYGRGIRNFVFSGPIDEWHAPGAIVSRQDTKCAVDAAWLVERVMGAPKRRPQVGFPGVRVARERALAWGAQAGLAPFQQEGAAFLAERDYALLVDEPGVGKTVQAIIAAEARLSLAAIPEPNTPVVLIVCPSLVKRHWQAEIKKWIGRESTILESRTPDAEQLKTRYIIANYDILFGGRAKDAAGVVHDLHAQPGWAGLLAGKFLIVINDEAHNLRGRSAQKTKSVKQACRGVPVVWGLTGTPMPNFVRDLWALVDVVSDGLFGYSYWTWAETYCAAAKGQYGMVDTGGSRLEELQGRLAFFMLGRTAKGVQLELPEKRREVYRVDVEMTAPTVHEGNEALSKGMAVASALRKTAYAKRSAVVGAAVEALQGKQKVVVFVYMREQAEAVAKDIKKHVDCTVHAVSGDVSASGRYEQAQAFREASSPACFVATIDSMGVGLSLVGANLMIFGDVVPEPWKLLQAEKRGHRFDSPCRLLVRYVIATGTIDEGIVESVIAKIPVIEQTLGQQDDASELTTMFGGRSSEEIVDSLFVKLKEWKAAEDE